MQSGWHDHPGFLPTGRSAVIASAVETAAGRLDRGAPATPGRARRETFREYVSRIRPNFKWYRHAIVLAEVLQRVADDELLRVIVQEPPRHGKSEEISRLFPAYYLSRHPERWAGITSYGAEIAHPLSRAARENYQRGGGALKDDAATIKHWETAAGGGCWSAGFGGAVTGKGFHLGIVDDPVKDAAEAASHAIARRNRDWYPSTFTSRAEPGAAIVVVQTRWPGPADLVGWLFEREGTEDDEPEHWHVVSFEAIKEAEPPKIPVTCTLEPDWRTPGEALCPERYSAERLRKIEKRSGPFWWNALYQQRPRPKEGGLFKWDWFPVVEAVPKQGYRIRYWDTAGTEGGGDYTVGVLMCLGADGLYYVEDVVRGQWSPARRDEQILAATRADAQQYGPAGVRTWVEQESGVGGTDRTTALIRKLAGFVVQAERVTGKKEDRADPLASQAEVGNVRLMKARWNAAFLDELCDFPHGAHDDQVDAASGAFNKLAALASQGWSVGRYRA